MSRLRRSVALVAIVLLLTTAAQAQDIAGYGDVSWGLADERESAFLPEEERALAPSIDIAFEGFVSTLPQTSWSFDAEALVMHTDFGQMGFGFGGDDEVAAGMRFSLGWENEEGYGIRTRLSHLGAEGSGAGLSFANFYSGGYSTLRGFDFRGASPIEDDSPVELQTLSWDLELYKRIAYQGTSLALGGGLRGAGYQADGPLIVEDTVQAGGVTVFSDFRQVFRRTEGTELAFVSGGRVSFLTGEFEEQDAGSKRETDANMMVSEWSAGMELSRDLGNSVLTLRTQYEAQYWNTDVASDLVFNGAAIRAGISW